MSQTHRVTNPGDIKKIEARMLETISVKNFDHPRNFTSTSIAHVTDSQGAKRVVALEDIKAGTRVASSTPISMATQLKPMEPAELFTYWSIAMADAWRTDVMTSFLQYQQTGQMPSASLWCRKVMLELHPRPPPLAQQTKGSDPQLIIIPKLLANSFNLGNIAVLYDSTISAFNHSCEANCMVLGTNPMTVTAWKNIAKGDELTIVYTSPIGKSCDAKRRKQHLQAVHGFDCTCSACTENRSTVPYWIEFTAHMTKNDRRCVHCSVQCAKDQLFSCARCGIAQYCSKKCQTEHWKATHKAMCV